MMEIIKHTPIWAWIILVILTLLGLRQLRPRQIRTFQLFIAPIIFFPLIIINISQNHHYELATLAFLSGLILGAILAQLSKQWQTITPIAQGKWQQQGNVLPLIIYLFIFLSRYFETVVRTIQHPLMNNQHFILFIGISTGICLGFNGAVSCLAVWKQKR
ncbi:hypothetical protein O1Q82_01698 [Lonepinella sp. MS14437]